MIRPMPWMGVFLSFVSLAAAQSDRARLIGTVMDSSSAVAGPPVQSP